jgi:hypothetical protein
MQMQTVIVFFGQMGAGKDTIAEMVALRLRAHASTLRLAFANPLKEAARHLLGLPASVVYGTTALKEAHVTYGKTARQWLQWIGTEIGREQIHPDVWVHRLGDTIITDPAKFAVISDGRFENERVGLLPYMQMRRAGPMGFAVVRVLNVLIYRPDVGPRPTHQSEAEVYDMRMKATTGECLPLFDRIIRNAGTLADLEEEAQALADFVLKPSA